MASWHFYAAYWTQSACAAVGEQSNAQAYRCDYKKGNDGKWKWFLYLKY
ncbi:hypothetical protein [Streptomyces sp. NPDC003032]